MSASQFPPDFDPELPASTASAAERAGSMLDGDATSPAELPLPLDDRRHLADQLWLDSLLTQVLRPSETAHRELLIQRLMQSIPEEEAAPLPSATAETPVVAGRRSWIATAASLAALIMLGAILFSPQAGPKTALAAVERSLQAAAEDVDREYGIQTTMANGDKLPPIRLTVHGSNRFVWENPVPLGTVRVGSNGKEFWMIPVIGPVVVADEGSRIERLLTEKQLSTPILNLTTVLQWLRDRYDLTLLPDEDIPAADGASAAVRCVHYRGTLRKKAEWLSPDAIEIWSARDSGVVQRMVLDWPALLKSGVHRAEVRIQSRPGELPANWYEHAAHHAAHRLVIHPPPGQFAVPDDPGQPPP